MTTVECLTKSGPYCRQVSAGVLASEPLTGKNISAGLRTVCTIQFTEAQTAISMIAEVKIRTVHGARRKTTSALAVSRQGTERPARWRRVRGARSAAGEVVADGITAYPFSMHAASLRSVPRVSLTSAGAQERRTPALD